MNVQELKKQYDGKTVVDGVSFAIPKGKVTSLIGPNGAGKSTVMGMISRLIAHDSGVVDFEGRDIGKWKSRELSRRLAILTQSNSIQMKLTVRELVAFGRFPYSGNRVTLEDQKIIDRAISYMELEGFQDRFIDELSGGQRTKVLLGKLLLEKPDILLLDEPTNYLDAQHIEWLKRYLQEYENAFILISHDIPFLNSVVNLIYHMENQKLDRYVGDYDKFLEVYEMKKSQLEAAYKRQQQEIAELQDFVARNKARVSTRNMAMSRQKKLDKMEVIELVKEKPKPEFHFLNARAAGKIIFETKDLVIGYDEPLSKPLDFSMERGEKIAVIGANGIGKTTFLKSILGLIPALSGSVELGDYLSIGYFEQEMAPGNTTTCIEEIWKEFPSYTQYEVRSALAKCGLTTKNIESQVRVLSGGEQAKVRLCKLINRETNILLLDEPTNHLDVDAKEELKRALKEYKGAVLLICHEPEFYDGLVSKVWNLGEYSLKI